MLRIRPRLFLFAVPLALVAGCSQAVPPHLMPLPEEAVSRLGRMSMKQSAPIMIRIFKQESELEVWKAKSDGRFYRFKTYPICNWSGGIGPKIRQGDKQAPEGFYTVAPGQMNPNSQYHLSFNLGFPNGLDRAYGRTGDYLMVHGDCKSAGCYAMTDALVEEIYALAREAFKGGQKKFQVQAYPFRMTAENMRRHRRNRWYGFWRDLKVGYDEFERTRIPPKIDVCERRYLINASFAATGGPIDPAGPCPPYRRFSPEQLPGMLGNNQTASARPAGPPRTVGNFSTPRPYGFGLTPRKGGFALGNEIGVTR